MSKASELTTTTRTDIAAFITARLEEDEAAARDAIDPEGYFGDSHGHWTFVEYPYEGEWPRAPRDADDPATLLAQSGWSLHANRHDPARVLAQVAALRAVVELHKMERTDDPGNGTTEGCETCDETNYVDGGRYSTGWPCDTLRAIAAIWSSHPAFEEAWR